jgi:hypothetical protein
VHVQKARSSPNAGATTPTSTTASRFVRDVCRVLTIGRVRVISRRTCDCRRAQVDGDPFDTLNDAALCAQRLSRVEAEAALRNEPSGSWCVVRAVRVLFCVRSRR